jgi:DNA invertase Pin-like site-specific DNA recombinase
MIRFGTLHPRPARYTEKLKEAGAGLRSLAEPWVDTTSPAGRMVLTVFAGIAESERELIHQRPSSGRVAAKARGVRFGRPPKLTPDQIALGERLVSEGTSVRDLLKMNTYMSFDRR